MGRLTALQAATFVLMRQHPSTGVRLWTLLIVWGLPVFVTDPHSVDQMVISVEHIGETLHSEKNTEELVKDLRERLSSLDRRLGGATLRRVLFVVWPDPLISVGRDTFIADAMRRAGGKSIVDTAAEWPRINLEGDRPSCSRKFLVFASAHAGRHAA